MIAAKLLLVAEADDGSVCNTESEDLREVLMIRYCYPALDPKAWHLVVRRIIIPDKDSLNVFSKHVQLLH